MAKIISSVKSFYSRVSDVVHPSFVIKTPFLDLNIDLKDGRGDTVKSVSTLDNLKNIINDLSVERLKIDLDYESGSYFDNQFESRLEFGCYNSKGEFEPDTISNLDSLKMEHLVKDWNDTLVYSLVNITLDAYDNHYRKKLQAYGKLKLSNKSKEDINREVMSIIEEFLLPANANQRTEIITTAVGYVIQDLKFDNEFVPVYNFVEGDKDEVTWEELELFCCYLTQTPVRDIAAIRSRNYAHISSNNCFNCLKDLLGFCHKEYNMPPVKSISKKNRTNLIDKLLEYVKNRNVVACHFTVKDKNALDFLKKEHLRMVGVDKDLRGSEGKVRGKMVEEIVRVKETDYVEVPDPEKIKRMDDKCKELLPDYLYDKFRGATDYQKLYKSFNSKTRKNIQRFMRIEEDDSAYNYTPFIKCTKLEEHEEWIEVKKEKFKSYPRVSNSFKYHLRKKMLKKKRNYYDVIEDIDKYLKKENKKEDVIPYGKNNAYHKEYNKTPRSLGDIRFHQYMKKSKVKHKHMKRKRGFDVRKTYREIYKDTMKMLEAGRLKHYDVVELRNPSDEFIVAKTVAQCMRDARYKKERKDKLRKYEEDDFKSSYSWIMLCLYPTALHYASTRATFGNGGDLDYNLYQFGDPDHFRNLLDIANLNLYDEIDKEEKVVEPVVEEEAEVLLKSASTKPSSNINILALKINRMYSGNSSWDMVNILYHGSKRLNRLSKRERRKGRIYILNGDL